ncbi:SEL1-like repeat protein [Atlantibacter sp.]|uniref:SEL1-like repeat protein n=1 Tax=Atlantibacter sp. TaxID=1903473 RepID=UPI0028AAB25C|nr:SEL1-like repeat protein [Atlantibacter sp.]
MPGINYKQGAIVGSIVALIACRSTLNSNDVEMLHRKPGANESTLVVQGSMPANTALSVSAEYESSTCRETELIFPYGEITNPTFHEKNRYAWVRHNIAASSSEQPFNVALLSGEPGKCQWHMTSLIADWSYTDVGHAKKPLSWRNKFIDRSNSEEARDLRYTPLIYALQVHEDNNAKTTEEIRLASSDNNNSEWFQADEVEDYIDLNPTTQRSITLKPTLDLNHIVAITSHFKTGTQWGEKYYDETIRYPDGTTFFFDRNPDAQVPAGALRMQQNRALFSPDRPESQINTLIKSADPSAKRQLAEIYELGHAVEQDRPKAHALYETAAKGGDIPAMQWMKKQAGYAQQPKQVRYWQHKLAMADDIQAKFDDARDDLCEQKNQVHAEEVIASLAANGTQRMKNFALFWQNINQPENAQDKRAWFEDCRR